MARHRHHFADTFLQTERLLCSKRSTSYLQFTANCWAVSYVQRKRDTHVIITKDCLVTIRNTNQSNLVLSKLGPTSMLILRSLECTNIPPPSFSPSFNLEARDACHLPRASHWKQKRNYSQDNSNSTPQAPTLIRHYSEMSPISRPSLLNSLGCKCTPSCGGRRLWRRKKNKTRTRNQH